ncbi:MAG: beta-carotene 15,15'-dioxygenase, Brp/Blh family [Planctomycetota bacterium]
MNHGPSHESSVLILGGGCAGLSLAWRLLDQDTGPITIVEPRTIYTRDRTWCFWLPDETRRDVPRAVLNVIQDRWDRWRVVDRDGRVVERSMNGLAYCCLPADRFYDLMLTRLQKSNRVSFLHAQAVGPSDATGVMIETPTGERRRVSGDVVVDTRPPTNYDPHGFARVAVERGEVVQQFAGADYENIDGSDADGGCATLMDFEAVEQSGESPCVEFLYVLPQGRGRALVEWTGMLAEPVSATEGWARLDAAVARSMPGWRRLPEGHCESGTLPMSPSSDRVSSNDGVIRLGVAGGACRPSTGYAFLQIQRQAKAIAEQLAGQRTATAVPRRPAAIRYLDAVFLRRMRREPASFPKVFADLFARTRPDRLARFLSDVPQLSDCLAVIAAMPKFPFAHEAIVGGLAERFPPRDAWQSHRRIAVAATLVLAVLAAVATLPVTLQVVLLVLAASVGMAHGATDVWLGRDLLGDDRAGRLRFGGGYLALTLVALALYVLAPSVWHWAFFVLAWLHFGFGELPALLPRGPGEFAVSAVRGAMPLTLPALLHPDAVTWALTVLVGAASASSMTMVLATLGLPTLIAALMLVMASLVMRRWWSALELAVVTFALIMPPPLIAFAIYFAVWHSARHLLSDVVDAPAAVCRESRPWSPVVAATLAPIVIAAIVGFAISNIQSVTATSSAVRVAFVTLGCLTFPHMILVAVVATRTRSFNSPPPPQPAASARSHLSWSWRTTSSSPRGRS